MTATGPRSLLLSRYHPLAVRVATDHVLGELEGEIRVQAFDRSLTPFLMPHTAGIEVYAQLLPLAGKGLRAGQMLLLLPAWSRAFWVSAEQAAIYRCRPQKTRAVFRRKKSLDESGFSVYNANMFAT